MNKEQWEIVVGDIMLFKNLVCDEDYLESEEFINLYYDLTQEEFDEKCAAEHLLLNGSPSEKLKAPLDVLDGLCDTVVTSSQLLSAITPSQLEWDYIGQYLTKDETGIPPDCEGIKNILLSFVVDSILDAEYYGCDMVGAMCEVSRSNLSKVPLLSEVTDHYATLSGYACEKACEWIELNREYGPVSYSTRIDKNGDNRVIFKDSQKKVMKWEGFMSPDLSKYIGG